MLTFLGLFLVLLALVLFISIYWYCTIPANLPPGPRGWPLIGSMLDTWKAKGLHTKLHAWTRMYGPIYRLYVADRLVIVLGDWDVMNEALVKNGEAFAGRPHARALLPKEIDPRLGIMGSEGALWREQRHFALATLRDFGIGRSILEPRIKHEVELLLDEFEFRANSDAAFDPTPLLNNAVANVICALVFNKRYDYAQEEFAALLNVQRSILQDGDISLLTPFVLSERVARVMARTPAIKQHQRDRLKIFRFVHEEITKCKSIANLESLSNIELDAFQPASYIEAFHKAQLRDRGNPRSTFTDDQLVMSVINLFMAGTDSTATTLRWALLYLAKNPRLQEELYEEIRGATGRGIPDSADRNKLPLTESTIMEIQRIGNLTPLGVLRRTTGPSKICGYDIPEDAIVVPLLTAILMNSKVYPEPEKFDPRRFLHTGAEKEGDGVAKERSRRFVPFQMGKRVCLGESLARMELFLFFTGLVTRFRFTFDPDHPIPSEEGVASLNRAPVKFKIRAILRMEE